MENQQTSFRAGQSSGGSSFSSGTGSSNTGSAAMKDTVQDTMGSVKDAASQTLDQVKEQGKSQIAGQKDKAADTISGVAHAMRQTGSNLRQGDQDYVAQFVDQAASRLEEFSMSLRNKDVNELIWEAQGFARRQPALFFGGAFLLGLFAARFFKSSPPDFSGANGFSGDYAGAGSYRGSRGYNGMGGSSPSWTGTMPSAMPSSRESSFDAGHSDQGMSDSTDWADRNTPSMSPGDNDFGDETGGELAPPFDPTNE